VKSPGARKTGVPTIRLSRGRKREVLGLGQERTA
jgi:hypothetical protein